MAVRPRMMTIVVALLVAITACGDSSELDDALAQISDLEAARDSLETSNQTLESGMADLETRTAELEATAGQLETDKATLEETLARTGQRLILQADIVGEGCMMQNAYLNDGEAKATFRVRVYDPATGEQLDDEAIESLTVTLGDGQVFEMRWGPHPPDTENDFFWAYGWEIFAGYPAGNVPFTISATAVDGRTGEFEPFNVAPSLLTVMDAAEVAEADTDS